MKVNVSELTLTQLDWLVAKIEKYDSRLGVVLEKEDRLYGSSRVDAACAHPPPAYSTNPNHGQHIIDREGISSGYIATFKEWECRMPGGYRAVGPTHMSAAMRCWVIKNLGLTVTLPEGLT
jgi:hypothetical protein